MTLIAVRCSRPATSWVAAAACVIAAYPLLVFSGMGLSFVGSALGTQEWGPAVRVGVLLVGVALLAATLTVPALSVAVRRPARPFAAIAALAVWQWLCIAGVLGALIALG